MGKKRPPRPQVVPVLDRIETAKSRARRLAAENHVEEAIELLSAELAKSPHRTDLLLGIARILLEADRVAEAAETLLVLKAHLPRNAEIVKMLGVVFSKVKEYEGAVAEFTLAYELDPNDPEISLALAQTYERLEDVDQAAVWVSKAIQLSPKDVDLRCYAAGILNYLARMEESLELLAEDPEIERQPEVRLLEALLMPLVPKSQDEIDQLRRHYRDTLLELYDSDTKISYPDKKLQTTNFALGYHGLRDRDLLELSATTLLRICPELGYISLDLSRDAVGSRRIKVGFVSSNMRRHSVGRVLNRFLKELDRALFEVFLFEVPGQFQGGQEITRAYADRVVLLPPDLRGSRAAIEEEKMDILVYPDFVLDAKSDHLAFSRLAPVQCSTWGHPGTSGRASIDYWISCEDWEPEGSEDLYTEKLIRLSAPPMIMTEEEPQTSISTREHLGIPEGRLYGCAQILQKIHPKFDVVLAEILKRDPEAHLVMMAGAQVGWVERFRERFRERFGSLNDRLIILKYLKFPDYVSLLHHFDVVLDPFEFGGGISTMEALTVGVPVVTCPGDQMRNRMAFSFYRLMNFMDLVVDSTEAYVDLALKVAHDRKYRQYLSKTILAKKSVLFDTVEITRELEKFFVKAIENAVTV